MSIPKKRVSVFTRVERLLDPRIKEAIAKTLVYFFALKEFNEYQKSRYQGHPHLLDEVKGLLNIAHRGFSAEYPENTLLAFQKALEHDVQMVELDVLLSLDGEIVVCHDADLLRLTGRADFIRDLPYQELQGYDVGAWKSEDYRGHYIPTLRQVFELIPPATLINIEIKHEATSFFNWETEIAVLKQIKAHQREQQVIVSAFNPMVVNRIRKLAPEISTAYLITQTLNPLLIFLLARIQARYVHVDFNYLNPRIVRALKQKGLKILSYTLNTQADYQRATDLGLTGIFTDHPDRLRDYLKATEQTRERKSDGHRHSRD
jgi:glycerophosphoryl diester phosphodiesterase